MDTPIKKLLTIIALNLFVFPPVHAKSVTYKYDALGRLERISHEEGPYVAYGYDATGNRQSLTAVIDTDGDSFLDDVDNCILKFNLSQRDTNGDGFGNICDADYDNTCFVNAVDIGPFVTAFGSVPGDPNYNPDVDMDDFTGINAGDIGFFVTAFGKPPGPSALATCP